MYPLLRPMSNKHDSIIKSFITTRGPDGFGLWQDDKILMLHARLAIVGLGDEGAQPMLSSDQRYVISFNGEIYNYKSIAKQFSIRTKSDTRVLVELISKIGIVEAVQLLDGPYAIACYDTKHFKLHLARDTFGEKPLFFRYDRDILEFSSSYRGLLRNGDSISAPEYFLQYGYETPETPIIPSIKKVDAGEIIEVSFNIQNKIEITSYPFKNSSQKIYSSTKSSYTGFEEKFKNGLLKRTYSDVDFSVLLSGGVDSIYTLSKLSELGFRPECFTVGNTEEDNEVQLAQAAAQHFSCKFTFVKLDRSPNTFSDFLSSVDAPINDPAMFPMWYLCQQVAKRYKVAFTGDGADELFGGYHRYLLASPVIYHLRHVLKYIPVNDRLNRIFNTPDMTSFISEIYNRSTKSSLKMKIDSVKTPYQKMVYADNNIVLPNYLLMKSDNASMSHGLELRSGFLNKSLRSFANTSPIKVSLLGVVNKKILRDELKYNHKFNVRPGKRGFFVDYSLLLNNYYHAIDEKSTINELIKSYSSQDFHNLTTYQKLSIVVLSNLQNTIERKRISFEG